MSFQFMIVVVNCTLRDHSRIKCANDANVVCYSESYKIARNAGQRRNLLPAWGMSDVVRVVVAFALVKADSKSKGLDVQEENSPPTSS